MALSEKDLDRYHASKLIKSFRKCFEPQIFEEVGKQSTAEYAKKPKVLPTFAKDVIKLCATSSLGVRVRLDTCNGAVSAATEKSEKVNDEK